MTADSEGVQPLSDWNTRLSNEWLFEYRRCARARASHLWLSTDMSAVQACDASLMQAGLSESFLPSLLSSNSHWKDVCASKGN